MHLCAKIGNKKNVKLNKYWEWKHSYPRPTSTHSQAAITQRTYFDNAFSLCAIGLGPHQSVPWFNFGSLSKKTERIEPHTHTQKNAGFVTTYVLLSPSQKRWGKRPNLNEINQVNRFWCSQTFWRGYYSIVFEFFIGFLTVVLIPPFWWSFYPLLSNFTV